MKYFEKRKLLSMLLMTVILLVNLMTIQVILFMSQKASVAWTNLLDSYQSYSEDMTVQESVYHERSEDLDAEPENTGEVIEEPDVELDDTNVEPEDRPSPEKMDEDGSHQLENEEANTVRVVFLGDCMMADNMARALDKHGMEYTLEDFDSLLKKADLIVANLETSIGTSRILMDKTFPFQSDPIYLSLFEPYSDKIVFSLANNHGMDAPLSETMQALDELGYAYVGVGENIEQAYAPHVIEINGVSLAIFGASQVMPTTDWRAGKNKPGMAEAYNIDKLMSYIEPWVNKVDYTISKIHWGEELADHPTSSQRVLEKELRNLGVNLVIGTHPHVLQAIEWDGEKQFTAHSMGNFVFTTSHTPVANDTAALEIVMNREKIHEARLHFGRIKFGKVYSLLEDGKSQRIIDRLNQLSHSVNVEDNGNLTPLELLR